MGNIEKIRKFVKELQQDFISIQPKDCSLDLIKSYAGYAYLDKVLSFLDTLSEEPDKSLEEGAYKYSFDSRPSIYGQVDVIDAFKAGAEWQASQMPMPEDTVLFNKGVAEGRRLEKEDMLKAAEECELSLVGAFLAIDLNMVALGYSEKDKVKVIVLKAEEE